MILQKSAHALINENFRPVRSHDNIDLVSGQGKEKKKHEPCDKKSNSSNSSEQFWSIHSSNDPFASSSSDEDDEEDQEDEEDEEEREVEWLSRIIQEEQKSPRNESSLGSELIEDSSR